MNVSRYEGLDATRVLCSLGVVFLHVYVTMGAPASLGFLIKLRDFTLPVMVLTSFFLLTKSLTRREFGLVSFFSRRVKRLWIPLIVWTFVYCCAPLFVLPLFFGSEVRPEFPSAAVFLTGYRHLWYLQFVFIASMVIYLLFAAAARLRISYEKLTAGCFAASAIYGISYYLSIKDHAVWNDFATEFDISLGIFISQASYYAMYVPAGVGIALISDKIKEWYSRPMLRRLSAGIALTAVAAHVGTNEVVRTREIYGLAVFLFALQPWEKIPFGFVKTLAEYSYGIYILHFLPAQILGILVDGSYVEPSAPNVLVWTIVIFSISFTTVFLIRKFFDADWLFPISGGGSRNRHRGSISKNMQKSGSIIKIKSLPVFVFVAVALGALMILSAPQSTLEKPNEISAQAGTRIDEPEGSLTTTVRVPGDARQFLGYRHKGVRRGEKLPNGALDLGGGLLSDEDYGVTRFAMGKKFMLWLEKIVERDADGVPDWEVKDSLVFSELKKNRKFLYSYSSPCTKSGEENLDLIVMVEESPKRKTYKILKAWLANIETERFDEASIESIACRYAK